VDRQQNEDTKQRLKHLRNEYDNTRYEMDEKDGFFCAFWVQKRAKDLLYFAEYKKHSVSWKMLPKIHMDLTASRFFPRMFPLLKYLWLV
jgi:hypothetical protein